MMTHGTLAILLTTLCTAAAHGQSPAPAGRAPAIPESFRQYRVIPSGPARFLASEEGRGFLLATGHPIAASAIRAFGMPSEHTILPPNWLEGESVDAVAAPAACNSPSGVRFNLEPRAGAVPQNQPSVDFLPNRLGAGNDLIIEAATDWRGNLTSSRHWDQSVSGYYVHRSASVDCSTQFEGGLPNFMYQGNLEAGIGSGVVATDPARDAVFMADVRFGSISTGGVGIFRAAASTLLNPAACPGGTHTAAQANSCWASTPPQLLFPAPVFDSVSDLPRIAVDERPFGAGVGAGDVYIVNPQYDFNAQSTTALLIACTNALTCGQPISASGSSSQAQFAYVGVRSDGLVTVSYLESNTDGTHTIMFTSCTPAGAPSAPTCGAPVTVAHLAHAIYPNLNLQALVNIKILAYTYPKHAHRAESGGRFTTFLTYDVCKSPFHYGGNPPSGFEVCLNSEVMMTNSTDNGHTWSTPVTVDTSGGHQFYPSIAIDSSTGTVHIVYYSTAGDFFRHSVRVFRTLIAAGGTSLGTPFPVTTLSVPIDNTPAGTGLLQSDFSLGAVARGTGVAGESRLYMSFDSTVVSGSYEGRADPELNNHISGLKY